MKNVSIISLATLSCLSSIYAGGKFNIGLAAGWGSTRTSLHEKLDFIFAPAERPYKAKVHGNGFSGGLIADYITTKNNIILGLGLAAYLDSYQASSKSSVYYKTLGGLNRSYDTKDSLKRNYTLEASTKLGYQLSPSTFAYGKFGGLYSSFTRKISVSTSVPIATEGTDKANTSAWGSVIGMGIQKYCTPTVKLGLTYDFHYYESLKVKTKPCIYASGIPLQGLTTFRPKYHQVYLTVNKEI